VIYTPDADKKSLRAALLRRRMAIPPEAKIAADQAIRERCLRLINSHARAALCLYWPIKNEPDLLPLAQAMLRAGRTVAFPALTSDILSQRGTEHPCPSPALTSDILSQRGTEHPCPSPALTSDLLSQRGTAHPCASHALHDDEMVFRIIRDLELDLAPARFGIAEPKDHCPVLAEDGERLLFVPGLGFDAEGNRLGYGKGYFDRYLARAGGISAGVACEACILPGIPRSAGDQPMRFIVSEERCLEIKP